MPNILFVDDEPQILDGMRNGLRKQRKNWQMAFVVTGEAALQELATLPYDVIVSDMRMPEMDGAALLTSVKQDYPHTVRIVLSGQAEQEISRRMVHVAHQFMAKPCDLRELEQTIERACNLQELLEEPTLRRAVGQIGQLPIKPATYRELTKLLGSPACTIADATWVIERDIGTSSKILQVVNSAFFGRAHRVNDLKTAISRLGLDVVKILALSVEMRESQRISHCPGFDLDAVDAHAMLSARIARRLVDDPVKAQDAFTAAMLQSTGTLILMGSLPDLFARMVADAHARGRSLDAVELETFGATYAELGAYLLGIWGLPYSIVEAVAHHRTPGRTAAATWDVLGAVHVASALAGELTAGRSAEHTGGQMPLDSDYLIRLGVIDNLPAWRTVAREEFEAAAAKRA